MKHRHLVTCLLVLGLIGIPTFAVADDGPATAEKPKAEAKKDAKPKRRPLLWMVEGTPRVFLYGTIHVADKRVTKHLPVVKAAFDQSTAVYTELRLDAAGQMQMQMQVMQMAAMPDTTLKEVFGDDLYQRVEKLMPPNIPFAMLQNTKPWMTQFLLMQTLMQEHHAKQKRDEAKRAKEAAKDGKESEAEPTNGNGAPNPMEALDPLIYKQAQEAGKQVGGLETIETQIKVFDDLSLDSQKKMIEQLVEEIEKVRAAAEKEKAGKTSKDGDAKDDEETTVNALSKLVDMWLAGDDQGFLELFERDLRKTGGPEADKFAKGLLDNRNVGMTKKILEMMKNDPKQVYFIAVGAGHMPGEMGIVKLLQKEGLKVRRLELGDKCPALPKAEPKKEAAPVK